MLIDIISYTDAQYAMLTEEQLLQIKSAQLKKNRLTAKLEENLQKEKQRLVENGTLISSIWSKLQEELQSAYEQEVEGIRDSLLFYLRFSIKPSEDVEAPYELDYSLTDVDRFYVVKNYYEATYTDKKRRYEAFKADKVAVVYLGEMYAPLHDYFLELSKQ